MYSEIKAETTEDYGIPASEVRFIQECKTDKARKAVIDAMNAGTVRVLFGSTSMLGTGVSSAEKVSPSIIWIHRKPSDLQQRDGRGVRAGNEVAKHFAGNNVDVIIYAMESRWTATSSTCCTASRQRSFRSSKAERWARVPSTRGRWTRNRA